MTTAQDRTDGADEHHVLVTLKRSLVRAAIATPAARLFRSAANGRATVFLLHRFDVSEPGFHSIDSPALGSLLDFVRRRRYQVLPLEDLVRRFDGDGPPLRGEVAFTIDDGYADQVAGASHFADRGMPVTVFVTTGFLDGAVVPWWDQIGHVFSTTARSALRLEVGSTAVDYRWATVDERVRCQNDATERVKDVGAEVRSSAIERLADEAGVTPLDEPAPPNLPMTWDDARRLEARGVTFGAHTVSHPLLSQLDDDAAEWEIGHSWRRVCEELEHPVPVFAYPNGRPQDFGDRDMRLVKELGLLGAVQVTDEPADPSRRDDPWARFRVDRVALPDDTLDALQYVTGIEYAVRAVRRRRPGLMRSVARGARPGAYSRAEVRS